MHIYLPYMQFRRFNLEITNEVKILEACRVLGSVIRGNGFRLCPTEHTGKPDNQPPMSDADKICSQE